MDSDMKISQMNSSVNNTNFQNKQKNLRKKKKENIKPQQSNNEDLMKDKEIQEQKIEELPPSSISQATSSGFKAFITSKKGIIILSLIATVVVAAAVTIPVILTQSSSDDDTTKEPEIIDIEAQIDTEVIEDPIDTVNDEEIIDDGTINYYYSNMLSLTKNNMMEFTKLSEYSRTPPTEFKYESCDVTILYNGDNSDIIEKYDEILVENKLLIASESTYDEIAENGKLLLNNVDTGRYLYKHVFSKDLYGGNIDDNEKAVSMKIRLNPISPTNYVTGLYAPPGEVIKIEISEEDLENIGGKLSFSIGQVTQSDGYSENIKAIGIKRVLNLVNKMGITKSVGYIGSFIGGPIYISNPSKKTKFTVTISNAVPYPHILFGITTKEDFEIMSSYSAPFFELDVRESIRYSGAKSLISGLDYNNLIQNLIFWDKCVRTSRQVPSGSNKNLGIHFLFDPCVNSNGALALAYVGANWCQVPPSFSLALNYETLTKYGAWGHIHELNHHFQKFGFKNTANEVTNNVINLVEYILYSQISGLRNEFSNAAITKISGNHNYLNPEFSLNNIVNNPPTSEDEIRFYDPILQAFGPQLFIKVTQYGNGNAGVDLFYESLVNVLHYDFAYYIEKIINLEISTEKKAELQQLGYPKFIPVSSIYQTGRYFTIDNVEYFSNTSLPYRIPKGGPTKLDFENHLIIPSGFSSYVESLSTPKYGTLEKINDKIFTYTPDDEHVLSGLIKLKVLLVNSNAGINTEVNLGLEFQIDNTYPVQTNYIFDSVLYTDLDEAIQKEYEGYSSKVFFPSFAGALTGITEGNVGIWEGKFRINDDGYKYILYKGGRGPSYLYAKINDQTEYTKIGYITINQDTFMFAEPSYAYYEIDLQKNDIVYFKAYLLGKTINEGKTANLYLGISKENDVSKVKQLGPDDIIGVDAEFNSDYVFYSGDPYYTNNEFTPLELFDYTLVKVTSTNFEPWDSSGTYTLEKLIDRKSDTYMHTKQNKGININNPLTLDFDLGKKYYIDFIYFIRNSANNYAPKTLILSKSDDNVEWEEVGVYTTEENEQYKVEINLDQKIYSRYIRMHITQTTTDNGYIALKSVEFTEKDIKYYQKKPEFVHIGNYNSETNNVVLNFENFPYFGHSYILKKGTFMTFILHETTGIRIKVCNKYDSKVNMVITQDEIQIKTDTFDIKESDGLDFPIIVGNLNKGRYLFKFSIEDGNFDLDYILYQI